MSAHDRSVALSAEAYGPRHANVGRAYLGKAGALEGLGRFREAAAAYDAAVARLPPEGGAREEARSAAVGAAISRLLAHVEDPPEATAWARRVATDTSPADDTSRVLAARLASLRVLLALREGSPPARCGAARTQLAEATAAVERARAERFVDAYVDVEPIRRAVADRCDGTSADARPPTTGAP